MYAGFLDLGQPLYFTIDGVLSPDECARYIARLEHGEQEIGTIIGREGEIVDVEVRNNTRVMWDDPAEAGALFEKIRDRVPPVLRSMRVVTANPRLRVYRYAPGQKHGAHWDTEVELENGRRTLLTFVVYLNDDFEGGATDFPELNAAIVPVRGRALLFQQRVVHTATEVTRGIKYVLRTDILYDPL